MKKAIPQFKNEDEEREFWDEHDFTDYFDSSDRVELNFSKLKPTKPRVRLTKILWVDGLLFGFVISPIAFARHDSSLQAMLLFLSVLFLLTPEVAQGFLRIRRSIKLLKQAKDDWEHERYRSALDALSEIEKSDG